MEKQIKQVGEFHTAFGVNILYTPGIPAKDRCDLRQSLIIEEMTEVINAIDNNDIVDIADGIIDSMYVLIGTAFEFGLQERIIKCFDEVHRSNMSKLDRDGKPVKNDRGKVIKSDQYTPPNLRPIVNPMTLPDEMTARDFIDGQK